MVNSFKQTCKKYKWKTFSYKSDEGISSLKNSPCQIPPKYGVYIIRASKRLNRVKGSSNVIYIGQAGGWSKKGHQGIGSGNGSTGRLFNTRGPDQKVREMIEKLIPQSIFTVDCYFTAKNEDPEKLESELLLAYLNTYYELPPANHRLSKK